MLHYCCNRNIHQRSQLHGFNGIFKSINNMKLEQTLKYLIKKNPLLRCEYKHLQKSNDDDLVVEPQTSLPAYVSRRVPMVSRHVRRVT